MDSLFWLSLNILTIVILGFFSMEEMAIVSFNKIRLQFFIAQGSKKAEWLNYLLSHPSRLFGTTLIGVNVAMMLGSEFAREFHSSIGLDPDFAPLSQVLLVIIFGELAPQFAARRFSEHVAFLGAPILYFTSKLMAPFVWILGVISKGANRLLGGKETHHDLFLTLEELQKILEDTEEGPTGKTEEFNTIVSNIFRLRSLIAKKAMTPIKEIVSLPSQTTIAQLRKLLTKSITWIPIYHNDPDNIVGIVFLRDLVRAPDTKRVRDYAVSPWFITENTPVLQVLQQFRKNKALVAVVINSLGRAEGILGLDDILDDIFGRLVKTPPTQLVIDVTLPGSMTLSAFNKEFKTSLHEEGCETLADLFLKRLEHHPEEGESLYLPPFEFSIKESSLMEIKKINVRTKN